MEREWEGIVIMRKTSSRNVYKLMYGTDKEIVGAHRYVKAKYTLDVDRNGRVYETTIWGEVIREREKQPNSIVRLIRIYQAVPFAALYALSQVADTESFHTLLLTETQKLPQPLDAYSEHKMGMIHNPDVWRKVEESLNQQREQFNKQKIAKN